MPSRDRKPCSVQPVEHRHVARPCLVGEETLKMAKMWVHFKNRLLDGTLAKVLLDFCELPRYYENRFQLKLDVVSTISATPRFTDPTPMNIST